MERLTKHYKNKTMGASLVCIRACIDADSDCDRCYKLAEAIDRLAAYEDTGLMPEGIADLQRAWDMYGGEDGITAMLEELQAYRTIGTVDDLARLVPPNAPLTLDELREMNGEPVWVIQKEPFEWSKWCLLDMKDGVAAHRFYCVSLVDYGVEWIAYRRKPEEEAK